MQALLDVVKVEVKSDYCLILEFENGEKRIFDMKSYLEKRPFRGSSNNPRFSVNPAAQR